MFSANSYIKNFIAFLVYMFGSPANMHTTRLLLLSAFIALLYATSATEQGGQQSAGVNRAGVVYGTFGNNQPSPQEAVSLLKSLQTKRVRLYSPDNNVLQALRNTGIEVVLGVPNEQLQNIASSQDQANQWIQSNVQNFQDINFRYIVVGNGVSPQNNGQFAQCLLQAMQNIQNAISSCGLQGKIKVSTALDHSVVLNQIHPPSNADFNSAFKQSFIQPIVQFLKNNNAPLLINLHPYYSYAFNKPEVPVELNNNQPAGPSHQGVPYFRDFRLEYASFGSSSVMVQDGSLGYNNVFDAMVDAVYSALEKTDGSSLDVVVSETGWPTDGGTAASNYNAATYNGNLISHIESNGTPKRPENHVETYIYNLFDENQRSQEIERHWGMFDENKKSKYPIFGFYEPTH